MSHPPGSLSGRLSGKSVPDRKPPADPAENKRTQTDPEPDHEPKHETGRAPAESADSADSIEKTRPRDPEGLSCSKQGLAEGMAERQPPLSNAPLDPLDPTRYGDWEIRGRCIDF